MKTTEKTIFVNRLFSMLLYSFIFLFFHGYVSALGTRKRGCEHPLFLYQMSILPF